jgi:hypothetical protein
MQLPPYFSRKLVLALGCYVALALIATFTLDGMFRTALYLFFALLAWRTIRAAKIDADEE